MHAPHILALKRYFESLSLESVPDLAKHYASTAYFKDPFNEVCGRDAIETVFRQMFANLDAPAFAIQEMWARDGSTVFLWEFTFRFRGKDTAQQCFTGMSLLRFDGEGKVIHHRDYWDAAEEIYEKFPLIGSALRWIKRRIG